MAETDETRAGSTSAGGAPVQGSPVSPGDVVAGYRIESVAGAGGMGVVYRATDLELAVTSP